MTVVTATATIINSPTTMQRHHTGPNVLFSRFENSAGTALSLSGVVVLGYVPAGVKISGVEVGVTYSGAGGDLVIGLIDEGSTTTTLATIGTAGAVSYNEASYLGHETSASDGSARPYEFLKAWASSDSWTGVITVALQYVADDPSDIS